MATHALHRLHVEPISLHRATAALRTFAMACLWLAALAMLVTMPTDQGSAVREALMPRAAFAGA